MVLYLRAADRRALEDEDETPRRGLMDRIRAIELPAPSITTTRAALGASVA